MCLILDTNKYGDFLTPENRDMEPVRKWMRTGKGKIAYSPTEKMQRKLNRHNRMREQFDRYRETDKLKLVPSDKVRRVMDGLRDLQSDDPDSSLWLRFDPTPAVAAHSTPRSSGSDPGRRRGRTNGVVLPSIAGTCNLTTRTSSLWLRLPGSGCWSRATRICTLTSSKSSAGTYTRPGDINICSSETSVHEPAEIRRQVEA